MARYIGYQLIALHIKLAMKRPPLISTVKSLPIGLILAVAVLSPPWDVAAQLPLDLGSAAPFAVLAGSGITITGATTIAGDIGTFPTTSITGFENVTLAGINHAGDSVTQAAKTDLLAAYNDAVGRTATTTYGPIFDLGGLTLTSGVYNDPTSFGLTGTLTLDALGDANAVWIFQAGSTLITAANSVVNLVGGAQAGNIFWQVGSSATLGTGTDFAGSILASESITLNTGAMIDGGLYALNGAVTLDNNTIAAVPEPGSALLLGGGLTFLAIWRRRPAVKRPSK
jgi:hypothetical protein